MTGLSSAAVLTISIDLELDIDQRATACQRSLDEVTYALLGFCRRHKLAATWAVADPFVSAATECVTGEGVPHELAILGDPLWVGFLVPRQRFARELDRRVHGARAAGLPLTTLALRRTTLQNDADLLVKQGITAVRTSIVDQDDVVGERPEPLRFGVWKFPVTVSLPSVDNFWALGGPPRRARRLLRRIVRQGGLMTLAIDGSELVDQGRRGLQIVERVLNYAAQRRDAGELTVETLAATAQRLAATHQSAPSRSILQRVAA